MLNMEQVRIFISHSSHDRPTAESLKNLICIALASLRPNQVLCTSVDGYGLPGGVHIDDTLRQMIVGADVVLAIISPEGMASPYVLFELGARWGSKGNFIPILAPGVSAEELKGPAVAANALKCESDGDADLHTLLGQLASALSLELCPPSSYVGHFKAVKNAREPRRAASSIYRGFLHLDSTLFHEVETDVRRLMRKGDETIIPTKYLFTHADSYKYYGKLVQEQAYTIAAEGNDLFANQSEKIVEHLLTHVAPNRVLTIVSLGIGFGVKEVRLLKELLKSRVQVSLLAIDQNPAFIQAAIARIKEECTERMGANLSCEFMIGDFDHIDDLAALLPIDRPTIFLALGGTFGNQDESIFLQKLKKACRGEAYLLMDFDIMPNQGNEVAKSGYATKINKEFISSMFKIFCEEEPRRVEALSSDKVFNHPISRVGSADVADVIVMEGEFSDGRIRYFGYSTRYNKGAIEVFLGRQGWPKVKEFDDPKWPKISLFLCKLNRH